MTTEVQDILNAARALPPQDQLELLQGLEQSLSQRLSPLSDASAAFWRTPSLDDLEGEPFVEVVANLNTLSMPDWPNDEAVDDLIEYVREQRQTDRSV